MKKTGVFGFLFTLGIAKELGIATLPYTCFLFVPQEMGRLQKPVWRCYRKERQAGRSHDDAVCISCGARMAALTYRMERHASSCDGLKQAGLWTLMGPKTKGQQSLVVVRTSAEQTHALHRTVARMIYANNLPFKVASNPEFRALLRSLRPGYRPPGRDAIAGHLLDEEYKLQRSTFARSLNGAMVTASMDGWSTDQNLPVIAISIQSQMCLCLDTTGEPHTGMLLAPA